IREIQTVSKFNHPNIVTYYTHFWQNENLFLVMEYCEQGSLRDYTEKAKPKDNEVVNWISVLASCLREVHTKSIIHCDIKPDNILVTGDGTIKLSDFGIANTLGRTRA